jgi:hypothetical protein
MYCAPRVVYIFRRCGQGNGGQPDMCGSPFQGEAGKPSMTSVYYGE